MERKKNKKKKTVRKTKYYKATTIVMQNMNEQETIQSAKQRMFEELRDSDCAKLVRNDAAGTRPKKDSRQEGYRRKNGGRKTRLAFLAAFLLILLKEKRRGEKRVRYQVPLFVESKKKLGTTEG